MDYFKELFKIGKDKKRETFKSTLLFFIMPQTGIEPVREYKSRRILSPVRLPVPPLRHFRNATAFQTTQKRLELSTSAVTGRRSNQLSHWAIFYISWIPLTNGPSGTRTQDRPVMSRLL